MAVWCTADTHFSFQRALEHSKRPFPDVLSMDSVLIKYWNDRIAKDDIVFHLGDFGDYEIAPFLNGQIVLIPGNHERADKNFINYHNYFHDVTQDKTTLDYNGYHITMAHEPSLVRNTQIDKTHINLFGHLHKLCMIKPYGINVGVDCHNFKPVDFETILFYHEQLLTYYDDEVFF